MAQKKKKICFVITSEIHYARNKLILNELKRHTHVNLQLVVGASALLSTYSNALATMERDGFMPDAKIMMTIEGGNTLAMAKTTGIGVSEFATVFDNLAPDIVVVRGDRYEVLSAAIAAAYLNIPIAHIEGGDITGTIDESVRHAITKLSHIHFTTTDEARKRVLRMGEHPDFVFNVGAPELEFVANNNYRASSKLINYLGVGDIIDLGKPYLMVLQHPVTSEVGANRTHIEETLHAIHDLGIPAIWFWPNIDAGTDEVSKGIRVFRETKNPAHMRFIKNVPADQFIGLLKRAACLVGNSSSGIKECSYLGVPVVNIGTRQGGRMRGDNVVDVPYTRAAIKEAIRKQVSHGPYPRNHAYHQPRTSKKIVDILTKVVPSTQKRFHD